MPSAPDFNDTKHFSKGFRTDRCILCRGAKMLCGKSNCPIIVKFYSKVKSRGLIDSLSIEGATPPSIFVGRYGYPKVSIGPMVPPLQGDTSFIDTPELWIGKSIEEIVDFRTYLVRGKFLAKVTDVENSNKIVELTREIALSRDSIEVEVEFLKKPKGKIALSDDVQPYGPSAPLKRIDAGNVKFDDRIEMAFYDTDLKAKEAVLDLYEKRVLISRIQKAFSVGAFGEGKKRRFVPTRWSITAVDSMIGEHLIENTRIFPLINEFLVYETYNLDNRWAVLLIPSEWCYELIEAWYPNTAWNPFGRDVSMFSDYEFFNGRKEYARIGGCYYAARLAVNEKLNRERRQAGVVVFREAHPGYILPVGVWNVRESVRDALKNKPRKFETLRDALSYISTKLEIPMKRWILNSGILKERLYQRRVEEF